MSKSVVPMFSSRIFMVSRLKFISLNHFQFIFVCGMRKCSDFIVSHEAVQLSQHHFLKGLSFIHDICLLPLLQINWPQVCGFISGLCIPFHRFMCLFFVLMPPCFDYCSLVVQSEVREGCFQLCSFFSGLLWQFGVLYKFQDYLFQFCENCSGYFDRD